LAFQIGAVYLRIDSIEQAMRDSQRVNEIEDGGYRVAYAIAGNNLRLGRTVISDSVNPIQLTRDAWIDVAKRAHARAIEVEVIFRDLQQHRERVEKRTSDISGLKLPTWVEIMAREYERWQREHFIIDTAAESVEELRRLLST
jgi:predicted kinase